jgi:hypothetical protein
MGKDRGRRAREVTGRHSLGSDRRVAEGEMSTWETQTTTQAFPEAVLEVLTDPEACRRWSPIHFVLESLDGDRLEEGSRACLTGRLAGHSVTFDVEVLQAADGSLALRAEGPVELYVEYRTLERLGFTQLEASIAVRGGRGLRGRLLSGAVDAVLAGGALQAAVRRVAREAESLAAQPVAA